MQRDIDFLGKDAVSRFLPSDRQVGVKLTLQKNAPDSVLQVLTPSGLDTIAAYIAPYNIVEVRAWVETYPEFLEWLISPDACEIDMYKMREKAVSTITEILNSDSSDIELNPKVLGVKLKAAELVLKGLQPKQPPTKINNRLNLYGGRIPKNLASKSEDALEAELLQLQRGQ